MPHDTLVRASAPHRVLATLHPLLDALTPAERTRAASLPSAAEHAAYVAAHLLVRACAAEVTGVAARKLTYRQRCPDCGGDTHGRPRIPELPGLAVSLSHTAGAVAAVAGPGRVAVDVQRVIAHDAGLAVVDRLLGPGRGIPRSPEAATLWWTRHECRVKWGEVRASWTPGSEDAASPLRTGAVREADRWSLNWVAAGVCGTVLSTRRPVRAAGPGRP